MKLSNEKFVDELMRFSTYGPLTQVFVIEAIRYYAEQVASQPEPESDDNTSISPKIWHKIAVDISNSLKENYEAPSI